MKTTSHILGAVFYILSKITTQNFQVQVPQIQTHLGNISKQNHPYPYNCQAFKETIQFLRYFRPYYMSSHRNASKTNPKISQARIWTGHFADFYTFILAYLYTRSYLHTCILAYLHTHAYLHTCILGHTILNPKFDQNPLIID